MNLSSTFHKIIPIILISTFFTSCAYFNTYYNTKKYYKEALEENRKRTTDRPSASERQKFDKTINQASKVLQLHPKSKYVDDALFIIGESFYHIEEYRKAERKFRELIELFPNSGLVEDAKLWLAKTQVKLEHLDVAQSEFMAMSQKAKNKKIRAEAQFRLGEVYWLQEKYPEANRELNKALLLIDDDRLKIKTYQRLGECYLKLESYHQAAESFHHAARRSKNPDLQFELNIQYAKALNAAGDANEAIEILKNLIDTNDQHKQLGMAKLELANSYRTMQANEKAIEIYNDIVEIHPRTTAAAGAFLALAQYDEKVLHNYESAEKNYAQVKLQDAKSDYAKIANKSATNIRMLTKIREEIARLQKLLRDPGEENIQESQKLRIAELDDDIASVRKEIKQKATALQDEKKANKPQARRPVQKAMPLSSEQIDSINVLITQKKIEMAELFLFQFEIPDSALYYYIEAISGSNSQEFRALAFYSIAHIYDDIMKRTAVRDSVLKILANNYFDTLQGEAASQKLGIRRQAKKQNSLALTFENAQYLLFKQNNPQSAVRKLKEILAGTPNRDLKIQTIYTLGWIYENKLRDNEQAISYYNQLIKEFPGSQYAKNVKKKIDAVQQEKKQKEAKPESTGKAAPADSTAFSTNEQKNILQRNAFAKSDSIATRKRTLPDSLRPQSPPDSLKRIQK
jgi:tetratricopeptide (TPR) repeat protein